MSSENKGAFKRRLASGLAATGIAAVAVFGLAGTAQAETDGEADTRAGGCRSGYVCGWEDAGYSGDKWVNWRAGSVGTVYEIDGWDGDNEISSFSNESGRTLRLYANDGAQGFSICWGPGVDARDLSDLGGGQTFNDQMESIKVVASC
ncbi:peptidase inhibitor family I36 protein [Glycomyces niveus]|jgi:hypothetical protein|uniref:Peptidase inhibitor family I36 protein n=1 Tax=Glycomyces niveus TaxID=2820287 RepID=A0ABS3U9F5_9ACTN|nr:peptidase inhibitor family I36 protein [Glycomyces sp. NEAU-S30]MBO3735410.1 peptidase inhibitor family I36 protein [Glycomyces sp. NEAU-S30]